MKASLYADGWISALTLLGSLQAFGAGGVGGVSGKPFNPDVSANFLGLATGGTLYPSTSTLLTHNGVQLQEAELQFLADVDPYFRASALLSVAPTITGDFGIDPEEVYFESTT